ncbi:serine/threonine-protein kinase SMG1-like isoform X2 [Ornithodoros turicata]|uniref:serine/threonine-protein kinase SMG1-like isoform X2 n=1 Tax=Ornithodoros turicata TaxID=34597 RepID=UPI003139698C
MSSGGRWFVSKTKETSRRGTTSSAASSSRARDDDRRSGHGGFLGRRAGSPPEGSQGGSTQLVFRRQGKAFRKGSSPLRTDDVSRPTTKGSASKKNSSGTSSEDIWSLAQRVADEPLRNLRLLRDRVQSGTPFLGTENPGVAGGAFLAAFTSSLEQVLGRPRLGADLRTELLTCITALGKTLPTPHSHGLVEWLLDSYDLSISDESRVLLLKALLEVLKNNTEVATDMLPAVMERSQTMLENADECQLLLATAHVTLWCARQDPDAFVTRYLRDTADILVGWHIDVASCPSQGRRPSEALEVLEDLGPLWAADGAFCATLLAQFVEDLCAYAEEPSSDALDRMGALLRVHAALLRSLGSQSPQLLSWELLSNNLHSMLTCIMTAIELYQSESFLAAANEALGPLCSAAGECPPALIDLVGTELPLAQQSESLALSLLWLLGTLVESLGPQFPLSLVGPAMGHTWAQGSPRPRVQKALLALQHRLLRVKSVPLLQEAYAHLLEALGGLEGGSMGLQSRSLGILCALVELANMRHSIIGMWALEPTLFELVTEHLCPTDPGLGEHCPALQYALLRLLHSHCARHGHFVLTSVLVTGAEAPSSGGHLTGLLRLLARLLPIETPKLCHDARMLGLQWVVEVAEAVRPYAPQLAQAAEFLDLVNAVIKAGFTPELHVSLKACEALQNLLDDMSLPMDTFQRAYELCVLKMGSAEEAETSAFRKLLLVLPVDLITRNKTRYDNRYISPEVDALKREWANAVSLGPGALGSNDLRSVLRTILLGSPCELPSRVSPHEGVQWGRALWGAAQLCVQGKLRTPLGKPQDTFAALEGALKSLLAKPAGGLKALRRAHLLLDFLEHLDRAMYNAYEGSAGCLPSVGRAVRAFFRTNRATCEEWVGRVRPYAARLALRAGRPAIAYRHASLALAAHGASRSSQDSQHSQDPLVLFDAASALVLLRCPDALVGLRIWSKATLEKEHAWLDAAATHATGRFESAAEQYSSLLGESTGDQRAFLLQQVVECQRLLGDWQEALRWAEQPTTNGYVGSSQQFMAQYLRFLDDPTKKSSSLLCKWDGWSAPQQILLAQHHSQHGCGDASQVVAALLELQALEWPPTIDPGTVEVLRSQTDDYSAKVVGPLLPPYHCCGALGSVVENSRPALVAAARLARKQANLNLARRWLLQAASVGLDKAQCLEDLEEQPESELAHETAKLLASMGERLRAGRLLARISTCSDPQVAARALLTLVRWHKRDGGLDTCLQEVDPHHTLEGMPQAFENDSLGSLLWRAVAYSPNSDKVWGVLGAHAYSSGGALDSESEGKLSLTAEENVQLEELLPDTLNNEDRFAVQQLLTRIPMWGVGVQEPLEALCPNLPEPARNALITFHDGLLQRATLYHQVALQAYCHYLHLGPVHLTQEGEGPTTAALRVVRLVACLGPLLGPAMEESLASCPIGPWKALVPQLLSLLTHPEACVQTTIQNLLEQVGRVAPHLLVYPLTVQARPSDGSPLVICAALLDSMALHAPDSVSQVQSFVRELQRIAVLWDELCLGALNAHSGEAHRRIRTLEEEVSRVRANAALTTEEKDALIRDKHAVFLKPTVCLLEELRDATCGTPETPHETWFQETLGPLLNETLEALQNPADPGRPQSTWASLRRLHLRLQRCSGGAAEASSAPAPLLMERVSPALAQLSDSQVPMPGCDDGQVCVTAVLRAIQVLPTKTKPKKLAFQGSDGRKYTFLFKGMEDLHLDERIMQLLRVVNAMLARTPAATPLRARCYAVTPLGPRSGLIQWLDGVTPLFSLYKRWQQRESATPLRPSEIFYGKLTPLLKEQGITNLENRREWPIHVLVETLEALMAETPHDLVAKELWLAAPSAPQWWQSTCTFCASTAVMSIVGYIIGLGDRHLDNVLVDLHAGEVLHIDYNVCFEKGRQLRVPEKVPFRMTPNLEAALGITGVEGQFRLACEHVLHVLRKGSDTLLSLLEALVWDPLVSFGDGGTSGGPSGGDLAHALLSLRLREAAPQWDANAQALDDALDALGGLMDDCQQAQSGVQEAEQHLEEVCAQQTLVEEALASEEHSLRSLPQRHRDHLVSRASCDAARSALNEKLQDCCNWGHLQETALAALRGSQMEHWSAALLASDSAIPDSPVAPLTHFLHTSGQGQLLQQCEQREAELRVNLAERRRTLLNCVELLRSFGAAAGPCLSSGAYVPQCLRQQRWQLWLQGLVQDFSLVKCQELIAEFHHAYGIGADLNFVQVAQQQHYELQSTVADLSARILAVLEHKQAEGADYLPEAQASLLALTEGNECGPLYDTLVGALCKGAGTLLSLERAATKDPRPWARDEAPLPLEDMCSQAAVLLQLADLLPHVDNSSQVASVCQAVQAVNNVFFALLDLSLHFETIIVPESLQRVGDSSVAEVAAALQAFGAPQALEELLSQLHTQHPTVENLREKFQGLLDNNQSTSSSGLNPGQMLLLGFNGLFAKLGRELATLYSTIQNTNVEWNNVDVVWGAKELCAVQLGDERQLSHLEDTLLVHSVCVMQQFFCCQLPSGSRDQMLASMRFFLADFYRNQVAGLSSLCVATALCSLIGPADRESPITLESMVPLSPHPAVVSVETSATRRALLSRLERAQLALQGRMQRAQLELNAHQWLHQEVLPPTGTIPTGPSRLVLLAELRKSLQMLCCAENSVQESWEAQRTLCQAVEQRLRWATGANPGLAHTQQCFEESHALWEHHLQNESTLAREVRESCEGLLQLEAQRPGAPEAQAWDGALLALLNRCQESCLLLEGAHLSSAITPIEEQLLALIPEGVPQAITEWLRALLGKVDLGTSRKQLEEAKAARNTARDALRNKVMWLRAEVLGQHHKLMSEVRSLLKALARQEGNGRGLIQEYLSFYRGFSEQASQLVRDLLTAAEVSEPLHKRLDDLRSLAPKVYAGLTGLVQDGQEVPNHSRDGTVDQKVTRSTRQRKGWGEPSNYALSVWKRVKTKLDGRDPDPGHTLNVTQQVDSVIGEATRLENLALLYEGWTPWV